jgi:hypothetical protein
MSNPAVGPASPITVDGLTAGFSYQVRVRARNAIGTGPWSTLSGPVTIGTVAPFTDASIFTDATIITQDGIF